VTTIVQTGKSRRKQTQRKIKITPKNSESNLEKNKNNPKKFRIKSTHHHKHHACFEK
jgi:hypothetical protein